MTGAAYRSFNIAIHATQNAGDGLWIPDIRIFSTSAKVQTINDGAFKTRREAEEHGLKIARRWVDRQTQLQRAH